MKSKFPPPASLGALAITVSLLAACGGEPASRPSVTIVAPGDGSEHDSNVELRLSASGIDIAPAGTATPGTAHHHVLIDVDPPAPGEVIPAGPPGFVHLGTGDSTTVLEALAPGERRVIALLGDGEHRVLDPPVADTIRFTVTDR